MMYNDGDLENTELLRNHGRTFFWIVADFQGRKVILGPKHSSEEANEWAYQTLDCPFHVYELPTRDKGKATSMLKGKILSSTGNLGMALQRVRHQVPTVRNANPNQGAW